ncbi:hypothetical protein AB4200_05860, partial [Vibrio kanaloae]|uniref:hypothetical protein n=1 Tax=Vibrio kanaloae TaxID=170673 RepID=UPI003554290A
SLLKCWRCYRRAGDGIDEPYIGLKQHPNHFNTLPLQNPVAFGRGGLQLYTLIDSETSDYL